MLKFAGKNSVFKKNGEITIDADANVTVLIFKAALKNCGTRIEISEESLASVYNKELKKELISRKDQNYLVVSLVDKSDSKKGKKKRA